MLSAPKRIIEYPHPLFDMIERFGVFTHESEKAQMASKPVPKPPDDFRGHTWDGEKWIVSP
jgi:hypothetical protein